MAEDSKWTLPQLQRQIAYDRLLERLYTVDEGWVLKGATALLARDLGVRASIDVDVFRAEALEVAERELGEGAALDLGDWFLSEAGPAQQAGDGAAGLRVPIRAFIAPKGRATMTRRVVEQGWSLAEAAEAAGVSERTCSKWVDRYGQLSVRTR